MYRSTLLSPSHYAGKWTIPEQGQRKPLQQVNLLGYDYATSLDGPEKEAKLLKVLEQFHGYMSKYLCMIVRGTVPPAGTVAGKDSKEFLRNLAPRGAEPSKALTEYVCKTLHLAFKQQTTEEIYDTLVFCFMKAARKYDPYYADKTRTVCEVVSELPAGFNREQLEARVGFDCLGICRSLVKRGFLASHIAKKKVVGYSRGPKWPAPASYFASGPIGFVYMLQIWFRHYFKEHIAAQMAELESNDGFLQLGVDLPGGTVLAGGVISSSSDNSEVIQAHADGNCLNSTGTFRFMADRELMDRSMDISTMSLEWVSGTTDKLFKDLTSQQRMFLYLYFFEEQSFKTMGKSLGIGTQAMQQRFAEVIDHVRRVGKIEV
jgi:hypothetical protein